MPEQTAIAFDSIPFVKMHGIGNDYVYVDAITHPEREQLDLPELSKRLSDGLGAGFIEEIERHHVQALQS